MSHATFQHNLAWHRRLPGLAVASGSSSLHVSRKALAPACSSDSQPEDFSKWGQRPATHGFRERSGRDGQCVLAFATIRVIEEGTRERGFMAYVGWCLCGLTAIWLLVHVARGVQRCLAEFRWQSLRIELLREELAAVRRQAARAPSEIAAWEGFRKFRVARKVEECQGCHSFYLEPHDGKPLPPFRPGQYLTFQLRIPGQPQPLFRCYSISDAPRANAYRCTIKKVTTSGHRAATATGRASTYFHDVVKEGDLLDVKAPRGSFVLDLAQSRPVVLLGAGIGITPLLSMLNAALEETPDRAIFFFLGVRNSRVHPFKRHLESIGSRANQIRLDISYSNPLDTDREGVDYHAKGRMTLDRIRGILPSSNFAYYVCGPSEFMADWTAALKGWGVPSGDIHMESFGPSSSPRPPNPAATNGAATKSCQVRFDRSGKTEPWTGQFASLLELAEDRGIGVESGCRTGSCGTCLTAIRSGRVRYDQQPDYACQDGTCLPCVAIPQEDLVLDA